VDLPYLSDAGKVTGNVLLIRYLTNHQDKQMEIRRMMVAVVLLLSINVAQAETYKLEFTSFTHGYLDSDYFTSDPGAPGLIAPDTRLVDIIFDASLGSGVLVDDPNLFHALLNNYVPNAGKISQVNLYNYGVEHVQYNPYSASPPLNYDGDVIDDPRDGSVDFVRLDIRDLMAPSPHSTPDPATGLPHPWEPLFSYSLLGEFAPFPDGDALIFDGRHHQGNWTISEVSAVPVPAALWLFGTGILGLIGFSKRKTAMLKAA
jgi:hypothetical protein